MQYITGIHALNLPCSLETTGDWHTSALQWQKLNMAESEGSLYGDYGIEICDNVPENSGEFYIANTLRALLDLLESGRFDIAQGARDELICNDKYTQEFFDKVWEMRGRDNWEQIDRFMGLEWYCEWLDYKEAAYELER